MEDEKEIQGSGVNFFFAEAVGEDEIVGWSTLESGASEVHPGEEDSTAQGKIDAPTLASSQVTGHIASDVTELGSVCIVEDLCLRTPIKKECLDETEVEGGASSSRNEPVTVTDILRMPTSEGLTLDSKILLAEPSYTPERTAPVVEHPASQHKLSDFQQLKAQLLSSRSSDTIQGLKDCKLCGRTFSLQETFQLHQLLHQMDDVHACTVCGRSLKAGCPSGQNRYQCSDCGKNFVHLKSLSRHQRVHRAVAICADG
ncbi:hypothetical protein AGOR_G00124560 [Albula goreensis]|uniref:C2H2-type domain-containing protein n=1 Tax=Albula goreensis TaxID=1534307 RepID=A0A8T3DBF5_9TELE|nr:hypothetical protein AGOR_G00124560 [Albula goreensis]